MSLIQCPECGLDVSSYAKTCVRCGYPISKYMKYHSDYEIEELAIKRAIGVRDSYYFPEGVVEINNDDCEYTFFEDDASVNEVSIPKTLAFIGPYIFADCTALKKVYISSLESWCKIEFGNFSSNPLCNGANLYLNGKLIKELTIPKEIREIPNYAFHGCKSLNKIIIPESVVYIGDYAFDECNELEICCEANSKPSAWSELWNYSKRPVEWGYGKVKVASKNEIETKTIVKKEEKKKKSNDFEINNSALIKYNGDDEIVEIPNIVTKIEGYAFNNCASVKKVIIPNSVTTIDAYAFICCPSLTSVYIPSSVEVIGFSSFCKCKLLEIECEVESEPARWGYLWNIGNRPVKWGCGEKKEVIASKNG